MGIPVTVTVDGYQMVSLKTSDIAPENRWKQLRNHDEPLYFWGQNPRNFRQTPFGSLVTSMCFFIFAIPEKLWPFHGSQCLKHLDALRFAVTKTAFTYKNYAGLPKWRGLHRQRKAGLNHGLPIVHGEKWWFNHVEMVKNGGLTMLKTIKLYGDV